MAESDKRLRELYAMATPGPWRADTTVEMHQVGVAFDITRANAELIAAMHEALPSLLDRLEAAERRAERAEAAVEPKP